MLIGPTGYFGPEGWLPDQDPPIYGRPDGWFFYSASQQWFHLPYLLDDGPSFEEWSAAQHA